MSNIDKIIALFENIKSDLNNVKSNLDETIDYEAMNDFIKNYENDIYSLITINSFKKVINLSESEEKELEGITRIIDAFRNNDALVLSKIADKTVIVVKYGSTNIDALEDTKKALNNVETSIAGVVVNRIPKAKTKYGNYYYGRDDD